MTLEIRNITELSEPGLSVYRECNEAQLRHYYEPDGGLFIAESGKVILRALEAGCQPVSLLAAHQKLEKEEGKNILRALENSGAVVYAAEEEMLSQISGYHLTGGLLCAMKRPQLPAAEELLKGAAKIAVLEGITNPTNIGAIFRSAAAFSVDAVLLARGCCDPLTRRAVRVGMGNVFRIPWTFLDERENGLCAEDFALFRHYGFVTAAMALKKDAVRLDDPVLKKHTKLAVLLGAEGEGLTDFSVAQADCRVIIPMEHEVDSLNVAAASAVAFWELMRS